MNDFSSKVSDLNGRVKLSEVIFLGYLEREKLLGVIRASTVLICPTKGQFGEGRSLAAMEGLVVGIPIVAPDFGPFPYLISHEQNGLLFKTDSIEHKFNHLTGSEIDVIV